MHTVPTTLLHSLEGMVGLDWEKLLKLQCEDGSFLFSPSSTAYALMQTKDENCLTYLNKVVDRFSGGGKNKNKKVGLYASTITSSTFTLHLTHVLCFLILLPFSF